MNFISVQMGLRPGYGALERDPVGGVNTLLIEFCASDNSELTRQVPYRSAALRISEKQDLTRSCTVKAIISIMKAAQEKCVKKSCMGFYSLYLGLSVASCQRRIWLWNLRPEAFKHFD